MGKYGFHLLILSRGHEIRQVKEIAVLSLGAVVGSTAYAQSLKGTQGCEYAFSPGESLYRSL